MNYKKQSLKTMTSKTLKESYAAVQADAASKNLFDEFRTMQLSLQQKMMQGQEITEEDNQQAQEVVARIQQDAKITKLMETEQRLKRCNRRR